MRRIIQFRHEDSFRVPTLVVMAILLLAFCVTIGCGQKAKVAKKQSSQSTEQKPDATIESADVDEPATKASESVSLAAAFPALAPLPKLPVPADNPLTDVKVSLGKLLFFDDRLSGDLGTSCASCHDPRMGWGDGNALSRGYAGTQHWRNSQTLVNTAFLSKLFWAGESPSLEAQADSAITGNLAGNGDPVMIEERLAQIPVYVDLFHKAFGIDRPTYEHVLKAIASFERQDLVSADSPLDEYLAGDPSALSDEAIRGKALFEGKAGCIQCHNGALLTDEKYHNLGLPEHPLFTKDPLRQVSLRYQHYIGGFPKKFTEPRRRTLVCTTPPNANPISADSEHRRFVTSPTPLPTCTTVCSNRWKK